MNKVYRFLQWLNDSFSMGKAKGVHMEDRLTKTRNSATSAKMKKGAILFISFWGLMLSACVQVTAPDKPIVINLNIAIRSEVLLRLDEASKKVTEENPEIF